MNPTINGGPPGGNRSYIWQNSRWLNRTVQFAAWQGEINGRESDMPGSVSNPCTFENCVYWKRGEGEPTWASFSTDDNIGFTQQKQSRAEEWGVSYSADEFSIWDVNRFEP